MKKLFVLLILSLFLFSCSSMKKSRTMAKTKTNTQIETGKKIETTTKIDTTILIKPDTTIKVAQAMQCDTAIIENNNSTAKSYYSPAKNKIVLTLQAKQFSVPVNILQHKIETETVKENTVKDEIVKDKTITKKSSFWFYIICFGIGICLGYYLKTKL